MGSEVQGGNCLGRVRMNGHWPVRALGGREWFDSRGSLIQDEVLQLGYGGSRRSKTDQVGGVIKVWDYDKAIAGKGFTEPRCRVALVMFCCG